jgi:hypothetical protein
MRETKESNIALNLNQISYRFREVNLRHHNGRKVSKQTVETGTFV